ncbi:MAG: RnfABCDGE type electron transport complex subunit D [Gammaproteobacteria bacterium]
MKNPSPISGPHTHAANDVQIVMLKVMFTLLPATLYGIYIFGWPALNIFAVSIIAALVSEAFCLHLLGKPIKFFLFDGSAILTGWLLAMTLPPWTPWWIAVIGSVFAIVVGKQVFGGIGQNIFNPAMLARVVLLISFPLEMTTWTSPYPLFSTSGPDFLEGLEITFLSQVPVDAVSGASILGDISTNLGMGHSLSEILVRNADSENLVNGFIKGSMGETSAILLLAGGLLLIAMRIISWHIPLAMMGSIALLAGFFHLVNPEQYASPWLHVFSGGAILGAFFIATDLVTSPNSKLGKIIFGAGCGSLVYIIRTWGGYPEGVAFAIVLMNAVTPLIDYYVRPRIYGYQRKGVAMEYDEKRIASLANTEKD